MKSKRAFTLVEIILAMVLLSTVFVALVSFLVTMKKWSANRNLKTLKLQFAAMNVLNSEFRKLTYASRDSIASSADSSAVDSNVKISIFRIRPALDGATRSADAPVLAFVLAEEK